ncbi:MAG: arylsulfatase [Acidobacteria bacterium]|nr:arylsulfatase [Acidobacteriota bacterium]
MDRREFLKTTAAGAVSLAAGAAEAAARPNIIFILADDLGYGDLGCYGQQRIKTPNLDRLAAEGIRFTQAYSGATVCAPSRCCLMTGKHGGHATVRGNKRPEVGLRPDEATLPALLKKAGYRTALSGKWGLGGPSTRSMPNQRGFDEFFGYLDQLHAHNSYPEHLWQNEEEVFLTENWFNRRKKFAPDLFTEKALEFVKRRESRPFFLYLAYTVPHADNELGAFQGNGIEVPSDEPYSNENWPQAERNFAALVTRMDRDIGTLMAALGDGGIDRNTLIVFSSDNGPHREGGHDPDYFSSRGPLRGIKRDLYDGGIRMPFLTRWTGRIRGGQVSNQVLAFWDILPSLGELAGVPRPASLDGISVLPALLGERRVEHPPLYWEFHERGFSQAVRFGDWKAVRNNPQKPIELYALETDIGEKNDVAAGNAPVAQKAAELMKSLRVDSPEFPVRGA